MSAYDKKTKLRLSSAKKCAAAICTILVLLSIAEIIVTIVTYIELGQYLNSIVFSNLILPIAISVIWIILASLTYRVSIMIIEAVFIMLNKIYDKNVMENVAIREFDEEERKKLVEEQLKEEQEKIRKYEEEQAEIQRQEQERIRIYEEEEAKLRQEKQERIRKAKKEKIERQKEEKERKELLKAEREQQKANSWKKS